MHVIVVSCKDISPQSVWKWLGHSWERYSNLINSSLATYDECEAEGCGCYEGALDDDLRPWREEGITWAVFKAAREYAPRAVHYQVIGHKLYRQENCVFEFRYRRVGRYGI